MAKSRGPAWQTRERVQHILDQLIKFVPTEQIKRECMKEWDVSNVSYWKYWKKVEKYLERATLRQSKSYKNIVLKQLEALLPECVKVDKEGEAKRDVIQTRMVLNDIRELLGLDSPKKVEQSTDLTLFDILGLTQSPTLIQAPDDIPVAPQVPAE